MMNDIMHQISQQHDDNVFFLKKHDDNVKLMVDNGGSTNQEVRKKTRQL
jgi:hypothetical protein